MRFLVVGLVNRPELKQLKQTASALGHEVVGCYSTALIIATEPGSFCVEIRGQDVFSFDVILFWSLKNRKWDWFQAAKFLRDVHEMHIHSAHMLDSPHGYNLSPMAHLQRLMVAEIPVLPANVITNTQKGSEFTKGLVYPLLVRGFHPGRRHIPGSCPDAETLQLYLNKRRGDRAHLLLQLPPAHSAYRLMWIGDRVVSILALEAQSNGAILPTGPLKDIPPELHSKFQALGKRCHKALAIDIMEIEVVVDESGIFFVSDIVDRLDLHHWQEHGAHTFSQLLKFMAELKIGNGPRSTALVIKTQLYRDSSPALKLARRLAQEVILLSSQENSEQEKMLANTTVQLPANTSHVEAWKSGASLSKGQFLILLTAQDRLSNKEEQRLRGRIESREVGDQPILASYSISRDIHGFDRQRSTIPIVLSRQQALLLKGHRLPRLPLDMLDTKQKQTKPTIQLSFHAGPAVLREERLQLAELQIDSSDHPLRSEQAEAVVRLREYKRADKLLQQLISSSHDPMAQARLYCLQALCNLRLGLVEAAQRRALKSMADDICFPEAVHIIAESFFTTKSYEQSAFWFGLIPLMNRIGEPEALYPYWQTHLSADFHYCSLDRLGKHKKALKIAQEVLQRTAKNPRVLKNIRRMEKLSDTARPTGKDQGFLIVSLLSDSKAIPECLESEPHNIELLRKALKALNIKDYQQGMRHLDSLRRILPHPAIRQAAWLLEAYLWAGMQLYPPCISALEQALIEGCFLSDVFCLMASARKKLGKSSAPWSDWAKEAVEQTALLSNV